MLQPKVYIKELNIVREVEMIDFYNKQLLVYVLGVRPRGKADVYSFNEVEFMENTGLKDKNGKYIYTGDIVTVNGTWDCIIEYKQSSCAFVLKSIDSRWSMGYFSNYDDIEEMLEVIGNIYENKELVKDE
ncbi:YopX family protein [Gemella morbillorum]